MSTKRTLKNLSELGDDPHQSLVGTHRFEKAAVDKKNAPTAKIITDGKLTSAKIADAAPRMFALLNVIIVEAECSCDHAGTCYWCHAKALVKELRS